MKKLITLILILISVSVWSQKSNHPTEEFSVTGEIKTELILTLGDLEKQSSTPIPDVVITNHQGAPRGTAKQLKGILIKELLKDLELKEESPKLFSEFYLVFIAEDGYRVVYSWNEIFNSPLGDQLFLITSRDGKSLKEMEERILILTPTDFKTGRRHIKGLSKIVVKRAE